jgi:hypothetical protein
MFIAKNKIKAQSGHKRVFRSRRVTACHPRPNTPRRPQNGHPGLKIVDLGRLETNQHKTDMRATSRSFTADIWDSTQVRGMIKDLGWGAERWVRTRFEQYITGW